MALRAPPGTILAARPAVVPAHQHTSATIRAAIRAASACASVCAGAHLAPLAAVALVLGAIACARRANRVAVVLLYAALGVARGACVPVAGAPVVGTADAHLVVVEPPRASSPWVACRIASLDPAPRLVSRSAWLRAGDPSLRIGDHVRLRCRVLPATDLANFDAPHAIAWVRPPAWPTRLLPLRGEAVRVTRAGWAPRDVPLRLRAWGCDVVSRHLREPASGLITALVWGVHADLPRTWRDAFRVTGTTHVLAISGTHLTILLAVVRIFARAAGLRPTGAECVVTGLGWVYACAVGMPASVVRAALMGSVAALARVRQVPITGGEALARAVLLNVLWNPRTLDDVGFQLSVLGTAGLLTASPALAHAVLFGEALPERRRVIGRLVEPLLTTAWVQILCTGVTAQVFGRIPLVGLLANLPAAPLGGVLLVTAMCAHAASMVHPSLARCAWTTVACEAQILTTIVSLCARVPFASLRLPPPGPGLLLAVLASAALAVAIRRRRAPRVVLACCLAAVVARPLPLAPPHDLRVRVLDVGQGDAILVRLPGGETVLVDAGDDRGLDRGDRVVIPGLLAAGARRASLAVVTHPHADHTGGMAALLSERRIRTLALSADTSCAIARTLLARARRNGVAVRVVRAGETLVASGGARLDVIAPADTPATVPDDTSSAAVNERSVVLRITFGRTRILLTGDAGARAEDAWLAHGTDVRCDVLKLGHHGSAGATSAAFLARAHPVLAIASAGEGNRFHHPSRATLARCRAHGVSVRRTDRDGAVDLRSDGRRLWMRTARDPRWRALPSR